MNDLIPTNMDDLEINDAELRHNEGGGSIPHDWQYYFQGQAAQPLQGLGQIADNPVWYKNPTYIGIVGLGALALAVVMYSSMKKDS
jgi:hypothetical protein